MINVNPKEFESLLNKVVNKHSERQNSVLQEQISDAFLELRKTNEQFSSNQEEAIRLVSMLVMKNSVAASTYVFNEILNEATKQNLD